ncbi:bifunctional adenosylcobinamide kinase/adenosylcobinamide-phosphate guanylyltransferase [Niallia sp. Krafla_26]|uniref:bifunctional adenosylcobinamide kinase/adenosylcobinamide-phosphate guanylyltransferase n=1 Tax=Niallia sp. Krafla_26 TaxID=3064703 RepID=UPI003D17EF06
MAQHSSIILITGGVRSGKSAFAEKIAGDQWKSDGFGQLHYIAAMQPSDEEMKQRIGVHQQDRQRSGLLWNTWEKPTSIGDLAEKFNRNDVVLLDCLTTWLNNELFFEEDGWQDRVFLSDLIEKMWNGILSISQKVKTFVIVSNEVLYEPINQNELVFIYSSLLGKLHQKIVSQAHQAYLVEAGIPILMKGETE